MIRSKTIARWLALAMLAAALAPGMAWAVPDKPLKAVSFADANRGYIAGHYSPLVGAPNGVLSWTANGGASWHAEMFTSRTMVAVDASADGVTGVPSGRDGVYSSSNLGLTWPFETPLLNRSVSFLDAAHLAGGRRTVVGKRTPSNSRALIASSVNGGSWTIDFDGPDYPAPSEAEDRPLTQAELSSIDADTGGSVAWAAGFDRTFSPNAAPWTILIYKTADAGSTWTTQTAPVTTPGVNCITVADAQTAFIGQANRTLLRTLNGADWAAVSVPSTTGIAAVYAIDAIDANHVLVAGTGGKIAWTANASAATPTWQSTTTSPARDLYGAQMITSTHWIVVGDNETIRHTYDGGATWIGPTTAAAPKVTITSPASQFAIGSGTISIEGTSTDGSGVGVAQVEVRLQRRDGQYWNGSAWITSAEWLPATKSNPANGWDNWTKTVSLPETASIDGSLTVYARATDGVGLLGYPAAPVNSDGTPPTTSITVTPSTWTSGSVVFGLSATDSGSGVAQRLYKLNGGTTQTYTTSPTVTAQGTTTVSYWSVDVAGNAETPKTALVRIDKTPPTTSCEALASYINTATLTLAPTDGLSGVADTWYTVDDGAAKRGTSVKVTGAGEHTVQYWSVDNAGNAETAGEAIFTIVDKDLTPPTTTISGVPSSWTRESVAFGLSALDTSLGVKSTHYTLNGGATQSYSTTLTVSAEGTTVVRFWSVDNGDNVEATQTAYVRIDKTAPVTDSDSAGKTYYDKATVRLSRSDALSGIAETYYQVDGGPITAGVSVELTEDRTYSLTYWSVDAAGNAETHHAITVTVLPLTPTQITPTKTAVTIAYGGTATISAKLTGEGGAPLANAKISLLPSSLGTFAMTGPDGSVSFPAKPNVKTTYTLQFDSDGERAGSSATVVVTPYAKVTTPVVPSRVKHTKSFKAYNYVYPKHTAGTTAMTFYFQKKNSRGKYVTLKTVSAKASDYSSARSKCRTPYVKLKAGSWRVRAKHSDAGHKTTYSSRKYFRVY